MYIYRKTPLKGDTRTSPLLKIALGFAQQGWPILPVRPFHLHPHIQHPCPNGEPLCLATGWHALTDESLMHMTTNEDAIREWWTTWPDAYVCLLAAITRELKARPLPMGKHQLRNHCVWVAGRQEVSRSRGSGQLERARVRASPHLRLSVAGPTSRET
jgi:Bifunctional DNA primase/polymerase, N-terminal